MVRGEMNIYPLLGWMVVFGIVALIATMILTGLFVLRLVRQIQEEKKDLLNRLMAGDFKTYVQGQAAMKNLETPQDTTAMEELLNRSGGAVDPT
jgi:hypothetical protein